MRSQIESAAGNYNLYDVRRKEYDRGSKVPFRVSPQPFMLTQEQSREINIIGEEVVDFVRAADELYHREEEVRRILDTGKPEIFCSDREPQYLFVRPDIIITPSGFSLCEIETSPFGLALADILNKAYRGQGYETMVGMGDLTQYLQSATPQTGTLVYSGKTSSYAGQIAFLADEVFSDAGLQRKWEAGEAGDVGADNEAVYRAFYLSEYLNNPTIRLLLENPQKNIIPSLTPYLEEKAFLALFWDKRYEDFFRKILGQTGFNHLRKVIPPSWIVGQEKYFAPGMPYGVESSVDLATLSHSKRAFVLKSSGFSPDSSWAKGVHFLHEKSTQRAQDLLHKAEQDPSVLSVVQEFRKGKDVPMSYEDEGRESQLISMQGRVRLTPYFAMQGEKKGALLAMKATVCENTDYIHASTSSINTAVATMN